MKKTEMIKLIRFAIEKDAIIPAFQPIYKIGENMCELFGFEALCRIALDDKVIYPDEFLPVAEKTRYITKIDIMMIEKSSKKMSEKYNNVKLFNNISPVVFSNKKSSEYFVKSVIEIVKTYRMQDRLYLEITERTPFEIEHEIEKKLNDNGIYFVIDDFGAGLSNLSYLKLVNARYIKLDGDFIKNLPNSDIDKGIVGGITKMFRRLHKETIAEFVEDELIKKELDKLGINLHQGYYYGKPSFEI